MGSVGEGVESELLAYEEARERAGPGADGAPLGGRLPGVAGERLTDRIRPHAVREARDAALEGGEAARRRFRALVRPYLDACSREWDRTLAERRRGTEPAGGHERGLAREDDPRARRRLHAAWQQFENDLEGTRLERRHARDAAARDAGAAGLTDLLWIAPGPRETAGFVERFEREAIAPLDTALFRALHAARLRGAWSAEPADRPARDRLRQHLARFPAARVGHVLEELGSGLGAGGRGVRPPRVDEAGEREPALRKPPGGARLLLTPPLGAGDWERVLGLWGEALRFGFVESRRGAEAARFGDPAADAAARALFGRLLLVPRFREVIGVRESENLLADLRLREAVVPRRDWSYLSGVSAGPRAECVEDALERAGVGPATPSERRISIDGEPWPVYELRGRIWALLLEEALLLRFGTGWFADRRALALLCEVWEAEPDCGLDAVAADLGVGTIDPAPVVDRCRP